MCLVGPMRLEETPTDNIYLSIRTYKSLGHVRYDLLYETQNLLRRLPIYGQPK